ncbi:MAG: CynX/NimT family MFS transporter [Jatrophihabitans sp.]|uniref:CynX/NimT family MFS transporter n=1 Tax=Jatrophihabitans sp. TaxID=1932789 RepID=UPI003F7F4C31
MSTAAPTVTTATPRTAGAVVVVGLALTGFSMRTAVTSVGPALADLQRGLHAGNGTAGVLTTLPALCFAAIGALAPRLSRRVGPHRGLVLALLVMTAGLVLRVLVHAAVPFLVLSVLALTGGAISNVLLPTLVKLHFPDRIGRMTGVYATALAVGTALASGLTVPIGTVHGGSDAWRLGLGSWALPALLAALPWIPILAHDRPAATAAPRVRISLRHSPTAWALTLFFAFQSLQAYVAFGWFAKLLHSHGIASTTAGWMVAMLSAVTIPLSAVVPAVRPSRHRAVIVLLNGCYVAAYLGLALAPVGGAWVWMVLAGIGSSQFPLALAMIGQHARTPQTTAALSAFAQSIGYVIAGAGPLLFGVLYSATGGWGVPIGLLFAAMAIDLVAGWVAARPTYVDDEVRPPGPGAGLTPSTP